MRDFLQQAKETNSLIAIGDLIYNPQTQTLYKQAADIELEPRTIELLELLLTSVGHPLSAQAIIDSIWQSKYISKNVLTNRISTLRALLQEHMPEQDATKLLVTYPRKGYFLNPASVSLTPVGKQKPKSLNTNSLSFSRRQTIAYTLCALLFVTTIGLGWKLWQQPNTSSLQTRNQLLIPKVELLLNRVDAIGTEAREYRALVKAILLQQQVEYPYTDIANQDAPSYFLDPINETPYFPGARNMQTSDYLLNIELKEGQPKGC
ncbi:hypothetical protein JCM19231_5561 [Vibrio ishigakensis]|uniref:OmpR/PhoB-type domain-containing protein n=1 Tax=Vibrio ishigakensis TaxID=1481914 RepID=A0A0B8NQK8_9VIBR|nr:hypothetical protein JCM19231_5561 [Vibrio ishigakensis]